MKINELPQILLKFGSKKHIQNSLRNGIIKFGSLKEYRLQDELDLNNYRSHNKKNIEPLTEQCLRSDPNEGLQYYLNGNFSNIKIPEFNIEIKENISGQFKQFNEDRKIFCLYTAMNSIPRTLESNETKIVTSKLNYDYRMDSFGEYCLIIHKVDFFIERIRKILYDIEFDRVKYIPDFEEASTYDNYTKHEIFKFQNEFRIISKFTNPLGLIKIGSLTDIAFCIHVEKLKDLEIEYEI